MTERDTHEALPYMGIQMQLFPLFPPTARDAVSCGPAFPLKRESLQPGVEAELRGGRCMRQRLPREARLERASVLLPGVNKLGMSRSLQ